MINFIGDATVHHALCYSLTHFLVLTDSQLVIGTSNDYHTRFCTHPFSNIFQVIRSSLGGIFSYQEEGGGPHVQKRIVRFTPDPIKSVERKSQAYAGFNASIAIVGLHVCWIAHLRRRRSHGLHH